MPTPTHTHDVARATTRGYAGIGVYRSKHPVNLGSLVRSAHALGGTFVFTIGRRYTKTPSAVGQDRHIPVFAFDRLDSLTGTLPETARLVCVETHPSARSLPAFNHPDQAVYLLGAEDDGLPDTILEEYPVVGIPSDWPLNVATAGSIVLYDRLAKRLHTNPHRPAVPDWWTE